MRQRRILSLWFPRLGAERLLRQRRGLPAGPFAVVAEEAGRQTLASLDAGAEAAGLWRGQGLRDAHAMCPVLITRPRNPPAEAAFLAALRRWAGRFSPWVAEEPPEALLIDLSGAAHLFGGEAAVLEAVAADCAGLGLTVRAGIADTPGAAWALARFGDGRGIVPHRTGDAIDQEARATRSRAVRRHSRDPVRAQAQALAGPAGAGAAGPAGQIAAPGQTRQALAPLPLAALRLEPDTVAALARLGLRRVGDILGMPRAPLARRFGIGLVRRLDQALGVEPEPVSPAPPPRRFAVRLSFPEPIGLAEDIMAGIDRLLPALCGRLAAAGRGARRLRLDVLRSDQATQRLELGLARPSAEPERLRPLLALRLEVIEPGFGIDALRLEAHVTEPLPPRQQRGPVGPAGAEAPPRGTGAALDDLIGRLGARIGLEAITRLAPAESHIPEKAAQVLAAAYSAPAPDWPRPTRPRPLWLLSRPEPLALPESPQPPARFRWRRRNLAVAGATGPERIAPEWWLDDPGWRSGPRDYWRVETTGGERLWLFYAHGGEVPGGWFVHGTFA